MSADVFDVGKITTTTGFHIAVGPAPDTFVPSFQENCPILYSYYPIPMSPIESLCDDVMKGSVQLVYILDEQQLPHDPTFVKKLHRDGPDFIVEGHYGGPTPFVFLSRKNILQTIDTNIQKLRCDVHNLVVNLNSLIDARHNHGLDNGDKAPYVREMGALVEYLFILSLLSLSTIPKTILLRDSQISVKSSGGRLGCSNLWYFSC